MRVVIGLEPFDHVTAWLAVTDATEEMGCMSMVVGSHQDGELVPSALRQDDNLMLHSGQVLEVKEQQEQIVQLPLQAGEFLLGMGNGNR